MKPEVLEGLLTDRALGELTPETAELLDAYLSLDAAAAARAAQISSTVELTRVVVAQPCVAPAPLDLDRLRVDQRRRPWGVRGVEALRLAACLALGLGAGWLLHTTRHATTPTRGGAFATVVQPSAVVSTPRFWSAARFAPELVKKANQEKPL